MQSLHHLLTYVVHDIDHMLRYLLSIYLSSISISGQLGQEQYFHHGYAAAHVCTKA